jgi:hypothetical protein
MAMFITMKALTSKNRVLGMWNKLQGYKSYKRYKGEGEKQTPNATVE